jgi:serine/threonine protein kinase
LIEGRSLREEMRAHASRLGQMRAERAAGILAQVCAGIEAAHRHGIIHRDLKPDNVMLETSVDGIERVLVLDFGIAKLAQPPASESGEQTWQGLTDENTVIGTPNYISPEQCMGSAVDARSDVYSLGIILYEMLTGHVPFAGNNTSIVLLKHLQEPPAPVRRFCVEISPQLEEVVLRALAKNPQQRFASAAQFADRLQAAASLSGRAPEPVVLEESEEQTMTAPRPVAAAANSGQSWFEQRTVETPPPTLLIERRPRTRFYASALLTAVLAIGSLAYFLYADWQAKADEAGQAAQLSSESTATASSPLPGVQEHGQSTGHKSGQEKGRESEPLARSANKLPVEQPNQQTVPAAFVKPSASVAASLPAEDRIRRDVKAVYTDWAMAAARGDWQKHSGFYADRAEYFRDGALTREKIVARKRGIFGKLDSYALKFSESPQVILKNFGGKQEADVIFERQWTLRRGRKRSTGRAQGVITLRREPKGWRIVSEKQIGSLPRR